MFELYFQFVKTYIIITIVREYSFREIITQKQCLSEGILIFKNNGCYKINIM